MSKKEDHGMMHFQDLYASPAKSDASSIDIYDGLDMESLTEESTKPSTPSRDCLDLYEEIITEEGNAKEATLNDLSAEYEKCQRQMKQLITKMKAMQSTNTSLQNENQCLKKNISALIKTARVEILRKEEEIDRLNQRFLATGNTRYVKPGPLLLQNMNKTKLKDDATSKSTGNMNRVQQEVKTQETTKDALLSSTPKNVSEKTKACVKNSPLCSSITTSEKQCKGSAENPSQKQFVGPKLLVDKRKRKELDTEDQDKDPDQRQRKEGHRSNTSNSTIEYSDLKDKTKCGKGEGSQESRKLGVHYDTNSRKYRSSSHDKSSSTKEKTEPHHEKEKPVKISEKSRKELKEYDTEKNTEHRHRTAEKDGEPRRSKRTHISNVRDESHQRSPSFEKSDGKRSSDTSTREKRSSEYSDSKYGNQDKKLSKNNINTSSTKNKHSAENKSERCDWDRRGGEKKRSRDEPDRSRYDRKNKGYSKGEKEIQEPSSKDKGEVAPFKSNAKSINCEKGLPGNKEENAHKDLKLSFMETLNLTLSPAKKKSNDTNPVSSNINVNEEKRTALSSEMRVSTENISICQKDLSISEQPFLSREPASVEDITQIGNVEDSKSVSISEPVQNNNAQDLPERSKLDESSAAMAKLTLDDQPVELDAASSEQFETHSNIDGSGFIDLDSFIEIDKCSGSESPVSEKLDVSMPNECIQSEGVFEQACEDVDNKISNLKPNITETTKGICDSSNTDLVNVKTKGFACNSNCFHDESSAMSIDLNFLRLIPKVISPLKSPVKCLVLQHTAVCTVKTSAESILYKELHPDVNTSTPPLSLSLELNKENCEPAKKSMESEFAAYISSDEMEEGEIISEGENPCISSPNLTGPDKETAIIKIPSSSESELVMLTKAKQPAQKIKNKVKKCTKAKLSILPKSSRKKLSAATCLDGVLKIIPPLSIQDVLQMLRIVRAHIRKKFMKFKMQVSLTQFHRFIEAATLCFITLVSNLDWSNLCSSPDKMQKKLCKHIESKLKQLKKNGIVDRIFEQRLIDMKKRLWKFVEEQLDCLFDTLKAVILKLCDKAKAECGDDKKMKSTSCARTQKSFISPKSGKLKSKVTASVSVPRLRQLEFSKQKNAKLQIAASTSVEKKVLDSPSCELEKVNTHCNNTNLTSKHSPFSPEKTVISAGLQKNEQNSTGLSFNLVSDDHMGDIFKSLLHDSDQLELNTMQENLWLLQTPEKQFSANQKFHNVGSITENKTPSKANFPWFSISPPHIDTLPRLDTVINPDVLDESCLLEVPTSSTKNIIGSEERPKAYSLLLEDLAVSLTVPSPLKSDSHLSFLRPVCDPESTSEVNAHCNEDALLDEEDAGEQDLHLTLDSDNSSIDSLEHTGGPGSFQCHPSEPMQAVIMEKSNDHFIVKIRRAISSSSPASDISSVDDTDIAASEQVDIVKHKDICENVQREVPEIAAPDPKLQRHSDSTGLCSVGTSHSEVEKGVQPFTCSLANITNLSDTNDSVFISPETKSKNSTCTLESTIETSAETCEIVSEEIVISHIEEVYTCPLACSKGSPGSGSGTDCMDFSLKKRKLSNAELPAKRQKHSPLSDTGTKIKASRHNKTEEEGRLLAMERSHRKHKRAASDSTIHAKHSPSSLSAKNVIKKKGEVVVSWTRDEDRTILLECQKLGPNEKTFAVLSSKMKKYPNQVEERFRQLLKLFKKSRNGSS